MRRVLLWMLTVVVAAAACRAKPDPPAEARVPTPSNDGVPVRTASVTRTNLVETVSGPGHTAAMTQQKIRAPFAGTLEDLKVGDGDVVVRGAALGTVVSRESEAALAGAREMIREARSPAERQDGERALALAERSLVRRQISASADGVVLAHTAARGDRVSEDQELLTIAEASSVVFLADVAQSDLARIRPGQRARVELAGHAGAVGGTVHGVMPGANAADYTVPVRVDLQGLRGIPPLGLFGTGRITVGERRDAVVVPEAALIRDDVTGSTRIAVVEKGRAHWLDVTVGMRGSEGLEITAPPLSAGQAVVVGGQVGLPEGAPVAVRP